MTTKFCFFLFALACGAIAQGQDLLTTRPATRPTTAAAASGPEIIIDCTRTPDLREWCETTLRPELEKWYPLIVASLPSNGFTAPRKFVVTIDPAYRGIAATSGTLIIVNPGWIGSQMKRAPWNEAVGSIIHEEAHVIQQYGYGGGRRGMPRNPVWLVEGIADYIRWFKYEPQDHRPHPRAMNRNRPASYTDSYQTTAAFLEHVAANHDHEIVVKLNAALREGNYSAGLWKLYTGKTIDELWAEYYKTLNE